MAYQFRPNAGNIQVMNGDQQVAMVSPEIAKTQYGFTGDIPGPKITYDAVKNGQGDQLIAKSSDGAVSSNDVTTNQEQKNATNSASSALNASYSTPESLQSLVNSRDAKSQARLDTTLGALKGTFDATLAMENQNYSELFAGLANDHRNATDAAQALATQLNPYGDPRLSSTTGGYMQAIDAKYQAQAASLSGKLRAAQALEKAQFYEASSKMVADAQKEQDDFAMEMQKFAFDMYKQSQSQANTEKSFDLQKRGQDISMMGQTSDDFRSLLTTLSGSPQLQADIGTYNTTGKISPGLQPIVDKGMQAGMSPQEAISIFAYQSDSVRKQQDLENYRSQQLVNAQERIAIAGANANVKIATMQMVQNAGAQAMSEGKKPGTLDYAEAIANSTAGSKLSLPVSEVEKYTNLGILSSQLGNLKTRIEAVDKNSALGNIILSRSPRDVQSLTDKDLTILNSEVQSLSGILGKSVFGESGNLSNTDIQRVIGALPSGGNTNEVRDALYKNIVNLLSEKAILTLQNQAANGYSVAGYAPIVRQISEKADSVTGGSAPATGGFDYNAWKKANNL